MATGKIAKKLTGVLTRFNLLLIWMVCFSAQAVVPLEQGLCTVLDPGSALMFSYHLARRESCFRAAFFISCFLLAGLSRTELLPGPL